MTNKFIVVLEEVLREDDAQDVMRAIKMLRGVATVTPIAADATYQDSEHLSRIEINRELLRVVMCPVSHIHPPDGGDGSSEVFDDE